MLLIVDPRPNAFEDGGYEQDESHLSYQEVRHAEETPIQEAKCGQGTFVLPPEVKGDTVHLVDEFNDWQTSHAMRRQKDGSWRITMELEQGGEYQFCYLVDVQRWLNDPQADKYVPNPYGDQNAVVVT